MHKDNPFNVTDPKEVIDRAELLRRLGNPNTSLLRKWHKMGMPHIPYPGGKLACYHWLSVVGWFAEEDIKTTQYKKSRPNDIQKNNQEEQ